jgi:hypothetical protein
MGAVMMTAVRITIEPGAETPSMLAVAIVVAALAVAAALIVVFGYAAPALPLDLPRENAEATSLRYFGSTTVIRSALAEMPTIVAFLVSFAVEPKSWLVMLLALPGTLALFWWHAWPSPRTAAAVETALESQGAESHLSESLGFR